MTAVAQEMLELAESMHNARRKCERFAKIALILSDRECELAEIALRESALSQNEVVVERMK